MLLVLRSDDSQVNKQEENLKKIPSSLFSIQLMHLPNLEDESFAGSSSESLNTKCYCINAKRTMLMNVALS